MSFLWCAAPHLFMPSDADTCSILCYHNLFKIARAIFKKCSKFVEKFDQNVQSVGWLQFAPRPRFTSSPPKGGGKRPPESSGRFLTFSSGRMVQVASHGRMRCSGVMLLFFGTADPPPYIYNIFHPTFPPFRPYSTPLCAIW